MARAMNKTKLIFRLNNPLTRTPDALSAKLCRMLRTSTSACSTPQALIRISLACSGWPLPNSQRGLSGTAKRRKKYKRRRNGIHSQHPAPIVFPDIEQKIIGEKGRRNAEHDHELIERDQTPAQFRRRDFRNINRRDKNRPAHRHAAENPGDRQKPENLSSARRAEP